MSNHRTAYASSDTSLSALMHSRPAYVPPPSLGPIYSRMPTKKLFMCIQKQRQENASEVDAPTDPETSESALATHTVTHDWRKYQGDQKGMHAAHVCRGKTNRVYAGKTANNEQLTVGLSTELDLSQHKVITNWIIDLADETGCSHAELPNWHQSQQSCKVRQAGDSAQGMKQQQMGNDAFYELYEAQQQQQLTCDSYPLSHVRTRPIDPEKTYTEVAKAVEGQLGNSKCPATDIDHTWNSSRQFKSLWDTTATFTKITPMKSTAIRFVNSFTIDLSTPVRNSSTTITISPKGEQQRLDCLPDSNQNVPVEPATSEKHYKNCPEVTRSRTGSTVGDHRLVVNSLPGHQCVGGSDHQQEDESDSDSMSTGCSASADTSSLGDHITSVSQQQATPSYRKAQSVVTFTSMTENTEESTTRDDELWEKGSKPTGQVWDRQHAFQTLTTENLFLHNRQLFEDEQL